jgi:aromatic amino acid aminotransferase I
MGHHGIRGVVVESAGPVFHEEELDGLPLPISKIWYFKLNKLQCDSLASNFLMKPASECSVLGAQGLIAFAKEDVEGKIPLFSFVPPTGGMFIWARFYFSSYPGFKKLQASKECADPEQKFEDELWAQLATALVLLTPGSYYEPWQGKDKTTTTTRGGEKGVGNFRLAYSMTTVSLLAEFGIMRRY